MNEPTTPPVPAPAVREVPAGFTEFSPLQYIKTDAQLRDYVAESIATAIAVPAVREPSDLQQIRDVIHLAKIQGARKDCNVMLETAIADLDDLIAALGSVPAVEGGEPK